MFKDNIASSVRSLVNAEPVALDRRGFLRLSVGTGAGLVIGATYQSNRRQRLKPQRRPTPCSIPSSPLRPPIR